MATRYWVGGSGTWSSSATANWSTTSGGAGGASAPTTADDVVFDSASNATSYTVTISGTNVPCQSITVAGPATGTCSFTAAVANTSSLGIYGNLTFPATGFAFTTNLVHNFQATSGSWTVTTNGVTIPYIFAFGTSTASTAVWTLGSALTTIAQAIYVYSGTLNTAGYSVSTPGFTRGSITQTFQLNLSSSTVTLSGTNVLSSFTNAGTNVNAGTSQINCTSSGSTFTGAGFTYYNVSFTNASQTTIVTGANTFNNLTFAARTSSGGNRVSFDSNQTINGTLTVSAGVNGTYRYRLYGANAGSAITLTAAAVSLTDVDFADITGAGAATWSGTRLGDIGNNSGITFPASKTVYFSATQTTVQNMTASAYWATTSGGATTNGATTNWPLAQDTCIFDNNSCGTGGTPGFALNATYSVGTLDFSAMTKSYAIGVSSIPWISGDIKLSSTCTTSFTSGNFTIRGYGVTQQLTTAGVTWNIPLAMSNATGTFQLQDNLTLSSTATITHSNGTLDANNYNITSASTFTSNSGLTRTLNLGSGTWTFSGSGAAWTVTSTGLTLTPSTSTLSFTSASAKTFAGGGLTYGTISQGGAGALTISGNNTFANITNTVQPTTVTFASGSTNTFTNFGLSGTAGNLVTLNSSTAGSQFTIVKQTPGVFTPTYLSIQDSNATPSNTWYAGITSTDVSGNSGWIFTNYNPSEDGNKGFSFLWMFQNGWFI